ncbi:uncharacterized protein B0I36DRAFT_88307 [Microdochium trichocladiopsis]|uniref:Uncharacterized protein n=1 Tax=Microdochium trichocladiopsis TaxID=1682393 RepID=A0A9P8YDT0_9PEZI|nr:uncharacterized protein B0I36DRAFT_88307 [Microdochium trichocladiopsis]KAH7035111.1 hypothetical protein B0I36DRAFT_88307 [Microdochium trichocladiopsis]
MSRRVSLASIGRGSLPAARLLIYRAFLRRIFILLPLHRNVLSSKPKGVACPTDRTKATCTPLSPLAAGDRLRTHAAHTRPKRISDSKVLQQRFRAQPTGAQKLQRGSIRRSL